MGSNTGVFSSRIVPVLNEWAFVASVYDNDIRKQVFFVNEHPFVVNTSFNSKSFLTTYFEIGHMPIFHNFFPGSLDDFFLFDEALSAEMIQEIRLNGLEGVREP